jgi:hypothetical protein
MKPILKDSSLKKAMESEITALLRAFDAWITETATAAWSIWDTDASERDTWALEKLAVALVGSGGLVPVAHKYGIIL